LTKNKNYQDEFKRETKKGCVGVREVVEGGQEKKT